MRGVTLLTYADRLGGGFAELEELLEGPLAVFTGVHVLPFYVPFDGADTGFDPHDHGTVDPRLGSWEDIRALAGPREVTVDLIVNHVSVHSPEFRDWLEHGTASEYHGMFLTFDTVFPHGGTQEHITAFHRPRPGLPFTAYRSADGGRHLVWTTFMPTQVDLDVHHHATHRYLRRVLRALADGGVRTVRVDAVGYAVKTPGTNSFMTEDTLDFIRELTTLIHECGMRTLVEVHAHHTQQLAVAPLVDLVYDFALPPLLLHSIGTGTADRLAHWLAIRPTNAVTVLDTHDGIGIIDAGSGNDLPGLLSQQEMEAIFDRAAIATEGESTLTSVIPAWMDLPHQINATFLSVLGGDTHSYLLARAVQFWFPGEPQVYYVGLLGGRNDMDAFRRTANGRDTNRHHFTPEEVSRCLHSEFTRALIELIRIRTDHPAFHGDFSYCLTDQDLLELTWTAGATIAELMVSFGDTSFRITLTDHDTTTSYNDAKDLLDARGRHHTDDYGG